MLCIATPNSLSVRMPLMGYNDATGTQPFGFGCGYIGSDTVFAYLDASNYVAQIGSGFFAVGERNVYAMTASAAAGVTFYKNNTAYTGSIVGSFAAAPSTLSLTAGGGGLNGGLWAWDGSIELAAYWTRVLTAAEIAQIVDNPWQLLRPELRPKFFTGTSSGNTYSTSVSETATASETAAAVASFLSNISETVTANETMIARAVFGSAVTETATASDSISNIVTFSTAVTETVTASETMAAALGAATFAASISETVTASETGSTLVSLQAAISETVTASDSISNLVAFISAVSETVTASDSIAAQLANQTYAASISETASASDVIVATIPTIYAASIIETISISDIAAMGVPSSDFWTQIGTTQLAGWGQINNTQSSGWTIIPTT